MSIAVLNQVYDEVRRLAIAGSNVAPGDFRLKKLLPALEQAATKSPVFGKIAESTKQLVESDEKSAPTSLLELGTLINAILYTQGETTVEGTFEPLECKSIGISRTQTSARLLKPLMEALTTTGSGRMEIIADAFGNGLFKDLRLVRPALLALDDNYSEIADFVATRVIPLYGAAIVPELESQFDPKGKAGHLRRLTLMHRLAPDVARPHVQRALEEGAKEMRVAAIGCLGSKPEDLAFLMEQSRAKAKEVRTAALRGLAHSDHADAVKVLKSSIEGKDLELAVTALKKSKHPEIRTALLSATQVIAEKLLTAKVTDKAKTGAEIQRLLHLLTTLGSQPDPETETLLSPLLMQHAKWMTIKSEPSGLDVLEKLTELFAEGSPSMQRRVADLHEVLPAGCLKDVFVAASKQYDPEQVFKTFSPYLDSPTTGKKSKASESQKAKILINVICETVRHRDEDEYVDESATMFVEKLSPKWLESAIRNEHEDLILKLARRDHPESYNALADLFAKRLAKSKDFYSLIDLLRVLNELQHPQLGAFVAQALKQSSKAPAYQVAWFARIIPKLPKSAIPGVEEAIEALPTTTSVIVTEFLVELKNRPET